MIGLFLIVAIVTGAGIGFIINAPSTDAGDSDPEDSKYLLTDCYIRVVGSFRCVDVFNQYDDSSDWDGDYYGVILKHCVFVEQADVDKTFTAEKGRFDTGFKFIFQFVSNNGFTSTEEFFASSGTTYSLRYWIPNGAFSDTILITLHMA